MFKKILNNLNEEIYTEANYSLGQFTFGFELEGYYSPNQTQDSVYNWGSDYWDSAKIKFKGQISGDVDVDDDCSLSAEGEGCCDYCGGDGEVECYECEGVGEVECPECHGSGEEECPNCDGEGVIDTVCPMCDGKGEDPTGQLNLDGVVQECPACHGTGVVEAKCPQCEGRGQIECDRCGGDGDISCSTCSGTGRVECPDCYGESGSAETYELKSPVLNFSPANLQNVIHFLVEGIEDGYINTNETCGFHIHIGFPDKLKRSEDIFWALCQLSLPQHNEVLENIMEYDGYSLHSSSYASYGFLSNLQSAFLSAEEAVEILKNARKGVEEKEYKEGFINESQATLELYKDELDLWRDEFWKIAQEFDSSKFRMIRQHPQGTMEWRGPRGFMNEGRVENVKDFMLTKLYPFVKAMNNFLNEKYLVISETLKLDREVFDRLLSSYNSPSYREKNRQNRHGKDKKINDQTFYRNQDKTLIPKLLKMNKDFFLNSNTYISGIKAELEDDNTILISRGNINNISGKKKLDDNINVTGTALQKFIIENKKLLSNTFHESSIKNTSLLYSSLGESTVIKCKLDDTSLYECNMEDSSMINGTISGASRLEGGNHLKSVNISLSNLHLENETFVDCNFSTNHIPYERIDKMLNSKYKNCTCSIRGKEVISEGKSTRAFINEVSRMMMASEKNTQQELLPKRRNDETFPDYVERINGITNVLKTVETPRRRYRY